ncbi:MAG: hypothetical protein ACTSWN_15280 [Promethearchaeota archaeon]
MIPNLPGNTASIGCAWAFYGLFFVLHDTDLGYLPKTIRILIKPFLKRHVSLWICTCFLLLVHFGWVDSIWWVYLTSGIPLAIASVFHDYWAEKVRLMEIHQDNAKKLIQKFMLGLIIGLLYSFGSIFISLILNNLTIQNLKYCIIFSHVGYFIYMILCYFGLKYSSCNRYIDLVVTANFTLGLFVGLGINMILA